MSEGVQRIGGFEILGAIKGGGDGRQGKVYRAKCVEATVPGVEIGEIVALKTMRTGSDPDREFEKLSKRTAALAALNHPNVLRYRGCFSVVDVYLSLNVIVMDLLEGESLKDRLAANPSGLDADEVLRIMDGALAGMACAAKSGIVHRDIKPGNIFLCRDGSVKIIDFELGKTASGTITASGSFVGTFDYMAPEFSDDSFRGSEASDVFSMGVVFHEAMTGELPYVKNKKKGEQADFAFLSRWKQRMEGMCVIHVKSVVGKLLFRADAVMKKALADRPETRYATAEEFRQALSTIRLKAVDNGAGVSYCLLRRIGAGGFGEVFKARDPQGRIVAVKRLLDARYGARFAREARVMRKLDDPAFVRFVDYFEKDLVGGGDAYLVMDFLPGMPGLSLRDAIKKSAGVPLPYKETLKAFILYARGLSMMHLRGIYHRDIKPSNLYYPVYDLSKSAIMDLGIARDVNGSVTTDQVPGTLDYMPYEIAHGTSRGDSAMDVYALGLSLYEALSARTAFPRLPAGRQGVEAFLQRARDRIPPTFNDPVTNAHPLLRQLLTDMTNIDVTRRLRDADVVRRRLEQLILTNDEVASVTTTVPRTVTSLPVTRPTPKPPPAPSVVRAPSRPPVSRVPSRPRPQAVAVRDEPATKGTQDADFKTPRPSPFREMAPLVGKGVAAALLVACLFAGVRYAWPKVKAKTAEIQTRLSDKKQKEIAAEREAQNRRKELARQEEIRNIRDEALREARDAAREYANESLSLVSVDIRTEEWRLKWLTNSAVAASEAYVAATNAFAVARQTRIREDRGREEHRKNAQAEDEAASIRRDFSDRRKTLKATEERFAHWQKRWQNALKPEKVDELVTALGNARDRRVENERKWAKERSEREKEAAEVQKAGAVAEKESREIVSDFEDEEKVVSLAEARYVKWQSDWGRFSDRDFYRDAVARIGAARRDRSMLESGRAVAAECDRWLANIESASEFNIENWRDNITQAELELKKALNPLRPRISEKAAALVQRKIDERKGWKVGVVDNKTQRTVRFGDKTVPPVSCLTVIFRSGFPQGAAITSEGCEPVRVAEERFDGKVFILLPRSLIERTTGIRAIVPQYGKEITCLVDGVETKPGETLLSKVRLHHVVYRRAGETFPGIPDYREQDIVFNAEKGTVVQVPPPQAEWQPSQEYADAKKNVSMLNRGRKIVAAVEKNLESEPVLGRRARLQKAYEILSHWETSAALAQLGAGVESELRAKYETERRRIRGLVRNETEVEASIRTDVAVVRIPAGSAVTVTFEKAWSGEAYVAVPNYEFVFLPRLSDDFESREFVVEQAKLVPLPVRADLPHLEKGVECTLGGKRLTGSLELRPGPYTCVYTKPDCVSQEIAFTVRLGENLTLPAPGRWEPSGALSRLSEAFGALNSGAVDAARKLSDEIGTFEDPAHRQALKDLKRAIDLRKSLEGK